MKKYIVLVVVALLVVNVQLNAQTYRIIVNNSNSITSLSKTEVSNFFLKKRIQWSNGTEVVPVDLNARSPVRETFSKDIHNKTTAQVRAFWQQSVFSGKATPPVEMDNDDKVIEFVKANPGAIGYVSATANVQGVKVITVN